MGAGHKTTLATITPINYTGKIFCPTVSTGAFVARRNKKIFITGNSGFPKSHNVGKAYDKLMGNDREVIKEDKSGSTSRAYQSEATTTAGGYKIDKGNSHYEGWGSALKPAHEPICMARKPLSEKTIVQNVIKWGTGAINIDGCRVETTDK